MRALARVTTCLALLALPAVALAATGTSRVYVPDCNKAVYKPRQIVLACGDGSDYLARLTWARWTGRSATGSGVNEVNNCLPDCVRGHFHGYPATVTLSRPKRCPRMKRHQVFGRLVLHYPEAHPGTSRTMTASLACPF